MRERARQLPRALFFFPNLIADYCLLVTLFEANRVNGW